MAAGVASTPRQPLTAAPYAITAGSVTGPIDGGTITAGTVTSTQLAAGAVTAASIASNSITAGQLAPGAAMANLNAANQSGVASGGLVLSPTESTALLNAGYIKIGTTTMSDGWVQRANGLPPAGRYLHSAVWTGTELIVWGGLNNNFVGDGARYNPEIGRAHV